MTRNMGSLDGTLRLIAAVILLVLAYTGTVSGALAIVAYVVAAIFIVTSVVKFCPAYLPFGINTCRKD